MRRLKAQDSKELISTEEIYEDVSGDVSSLSKTYFIFIVLPSIVISGLLVGSQYFYGSIGAGLLFLVNLVCINLAGVLTFFV